MVDRLVNFGFDALDRPVIGALVAVILTLTLMLGGCDGEDAAAEMARLRVGVLPGESPEVLRRQYLPLLAYLEQTVGVPCELQIADSYESLLSSFRRDEIDLAHFGGFTYVAARELAGAVPLVLRAEDRQFISYYLVAGGSPAGSVHDLVGSRLAFGSRLSTSGHLMPRHFLEEQGIVPEHFFREVQYTGSHEATARAVARGAADVGVANALIIDAMLGDGRLAPDAIRILDESPPFVDYVWTATARMPEPLQAAVLDAFLALDPEQDKQLRILRGLDTRAFLPATTEEFDDIIAAVDHLDLLEDLR